MEIDDMWDDEEDFANHSKAVRERSTMIEQCECENDGWTEGMHDPECPNHQPPRITDVPERIWLCHGDISSELGNVKHSDCDEVTWCADQIDSSDVKYIRADTMPAEWNKDSSLQTWFPLAAEEMERLKSEVERLHEVLAAEQCKVLALQSCQENMQWRKGSPPHPWGEEYFIADTKHGPMVVRKLDKPHAYDFTTADHTYIKAGGIIQWMQFPDSEFKPAPLDGQSQPRPLSGEQS